MKEEKNETTDSARETQTGRQTTSTSVFVLKHRLAVSRSGVFLLIPYMYNSTDSSLEMLPRLRKTCLTNTVHVK